MIYPDTSFHEQADRAGRLDIPIARQPWRMLPCAMPVHDWRRVTAGTFHDFHLAWIAELRRVLNGGLLPRGYYALAEQVAGDIIPEVLTLQQSPESLEPEGFREEFSADSGAAVLTVADSPPRVSMTATMVIESEAEWSDNRNGRSETDRCLLPWLAD